MRGFRYWRKKGNGNGSGDIGGSLSISKWFHIYSIKLFLLRFVIEILLYYFRGEGRKIRFLSLTRKWFGFDYTLVAWFSFGLINKVNRYRNEAESSKIINCNDYNWIDVKEFNHSLQLFLRSTKLSDNYDNSFMILSLIFIISLSRNFLNHLYIFPFFLFTILSLHKIFFFLHIFIFCKNKRACRNTL